METEGAGRERESARAPEWRAPPAIGPLETLPVFLRLAGRKAVLTGRGPGVAWKLDLLASSGAEVLAFLPDWGDAQAPEGVRIVRGKPASEDFENARIVVVDEEDPAEIERVRLAAHRAGALVNVVDKPEYCDFSFGSIVNRSPLVVAIATGGAAPVFGQAIRARVEAALPDSIGDWLRFARLIRPRIAERELPGSARRSLWEKLVAAMERGGRPPGGAQASAYIDTALAGAEQARGRIILVGAGPGDPELLTLKAVRALQSADVVLFDDLAPPRALELARREAERISVGKRGHAPSVGQKDISALLVELGRAGKTVVRLKGGDPAVFGRANEELAAAQAAGIACEIVPGVTAALAAAAALGASLSEREKARRIQFITAHAADGSLPQGMEWRALVDPDAATAVYMGVKTLPALVQRLLSEGLNPDTPAALVESAATPGERRILARIADMPKQVAAAKPTGPCILLYGRTFDHLSDAAR